MRFSTVILSLFVVVGAAGAARADVAPPDTCTAPGQPCQNAGTQYNQPGTCTATTCMKAMPRSDGGFTEITYACNKCVPTGAGGSGGSAATGGSGGSAATGGSGGSAATGGTGGSAATGGTGGSAATGGSGGSSAPPGTGGAVDSQGQHSSSCSIAPGRPSDDVFGALAAMVAIGLAGLFRRRHATN